MAKPNFIIVMVDQMQAGLRAGEGFPLETMPFLDSMARQGAWFDRAYTASPICMAARVSMLTGLYPATHRMRDNQSPGQQCFSADLLDVMHSQGYVTALVGKNHSHADRKDFSYVREYEHRGAMPGFQKPEYQAFDDYMMTLCFAADDQPAPFPVGHQLPARIVDDALEFMDEVAAQPFFMWLSFPEPHNPYQVPEPYFSLFPVDELPPAHAGAEALAGKPYSYRHAHLMWEKMREAGVVGPLARSRATYLGMMRLIDDQLRRLDEGLRAHGLAENTHVIFVADHGDFVGEYDMMRKGPQLCEVLARIPLVWRGPGVKARAGACPAFANLVDLLPTICDFAQAPVPPGIQGDSLAAVLRGETDHARDDAYCEVGYGGLFWEEGDDGLPPEVEGTLCVTGSPWTYYDELNTWTQCGFSRMLRWENWKLVLDALGRVQLYDIAADPFELRDLAADPALEPVRAQLMARLLRRLAGAAC